MLGDNTSGKTSLIAKLQGVEDPKKGSGLEYAYIDVRDEYRDGSYIEQFHFIAATTFVYSRSHKIRRVGVGWRSWSPEFAEIRA